MSYIERRALEAIKPLVDSFFAMYGGDFVLSAESSDETIRRYSVQTHQLMSSIRKQIYIVSKDTYLQ